MLQSKVDICKYSEESGELEKIGQKSLFSIALKISQHGSIGWALNSTILTLLNDFYLAIYYCMEDRRFQIYFN